MSIALCEYVHQGFVYNKSPRNMSRPKEGRSPNRWAEKEVRDGKYLQGDVFAPWSCFQRIAMTYGSKTSIINDELGGFSVLTLRCTDSIWILSEFCLFDRQRSNCNLLYCLWCIASCVILVYLYFVLIK